MSRGIFGWDLPPGCTMRDIDEQAGVYARCEVCGEPVDTCVCPECPTCSEIGDVGCYAGRHGLKLTQEQIISFAWNEALIEAESRAEEELYRKYGEPGT